MSTRLYKECLAIRMFTSVRNALSSEANLDICECCKLVSAGTFLKVLVLFIHANI